MHLTGFTWVWMNVQRKAILLPYSLLMHTTTDSSKQTRPTGQGWLSNRVWARIHGIWGEKFQSEDDNLQLWNGFHPLFCPCNSYPCYETKWPQLVKLNKSSTIDKGPVCELLLINPIIILYWVSGCLILNIFIFTEHLLIVGLVLSKLLVLVCFKIIVSC